MSENTPLLLGKEGRNQDTVKVVPMRYQDLGRVTDTVEKAFEGDLMLEYVFGADTSPFPVTRLRLRNGSNWVGAIHQHRLLSVDAGDAFLQYSTPDNRTPLRIVQAIQKMLGPLQSKEAQKRFKEYNVKLEKMIEAAFGRPERLEEMYEIEGLGTTPAKQGRGYATALVRTVLDMSDADGRDSIVVTGRSRWFYVTLGYEVVATGSLGEDNPKWDRGAVEFYLMYRPAKSAMV